MSENIYLSYPLSQQMPVATRPGRCCHVFGWSLPVLAPFLHSPSLSLSRSLPLYFPSSPSFGFFLFGKRFSPFLPRDRTLTLRRRSRGVENTGSTTRRDETDVSRSFLSIARTVTFRLRDTPPFSSRPPPPHSIESFSNQFELAIPPFLPPRQEQIPRYSPNREHLAIKLSIIRDLRCLLFSIVRVRPLDDLGSRIPKCLAVSLAIEERERKRERVSGCWKEKIEGRSVSQGGWAGWF